MPALRPGGATAGLAPEWRDARRGAWPVYADRMASSGSSVPVEGYRLTNISPRAFQHPADRAATAALGSIPYLESNSTFVS